MRFETLEFPNPEGLRLSARLDLPADGRARSYALFAHCFTCGKDARAAFYISRALTQAGLAVLRFDFTGLGQSEGNFADTNFTSNVDDLVEAARFMTARGMAPAILIGHSLGGAAVIQAAAAIPSVQAVAVIGAPAEPAHVKQHLKGAQDRIDQEGQAEVQLGGRAFRIKKQFLDDVDQVRMETTLQNLGRALLILHSPTDDVVGIENAARIYRAARHPKSFVSLDGADHLLADPADARYAGQLTAVWAARYVETLDLPATRDDLSINRIVVRTGRQGFLSDIVANGHRLSADEPEAVGGTNQGPTPYDLLLSALGACTGMTLRMYADRKQWPLEEIAVQLTHARIHAEDCSACESETGFIDHIEREIELHGPLTGEQRQRLKTIADRCPVHRTLQSETIIATRLKNSTEGHSA
ncbi:MAG: alpha/beta fold hydrolase [Desulfosarcina sp.]|nr:alpha/beta fold hydrolase [Desulfobacterales bacterium]